MLDGFNEGWIEFENGEAGSIKGKSNWTVLRDLVERSIDVLVTNLVDGDPNTSHGAANHSAAQCRAGKRRSARGCDKMRSWAHDV